ncbi:HNH endonuclease [Hydrogenovibrio kuenenii]|uniref:HNH endonuclease n=1 Tax=Hydrogenovibrio kuenenii TaxID=63658 RepID=UPI0004643AE9|nr:HNH endonuclease [Hydrogenovibrio kuenenii]
MKNPKWMNEVTEAFRAHNGVASLKDIYQYITTHSKSDYADPKTWEAQIRRVIYTHSSDCEIFNGKDDLFISEDGKGNGVWRMRSSYNVESVSELKDLPIGALLNATQISQITGINQVKGIHPVNSDSVNAVILCTTGSNNDYPNEWIQKYNTLKYYLEGKKTDTGEKKYNPSIKSNLVVNNATESSPLLVFSRSKKNEKFTFFGKFVPEKHIVHEADGGMFFILQRIHHPMQLGSILTSEDDEQFPEGKIKERMHKTRERNSRLIAEAKKQFKAKHGKLFCEICGFNFEEKYGHEIGKDFIEAHHTKPISELKENDTTNISDLAMVCSNCHRMIHRARPWKSPQDLKSILE